MRTDTSASQLYFCTAYIEARLPDGEAEIGTGFLFNAGGPGGPGQEPLPLLISNKHVLLESALELRINFLARTPDGSTFVPGQVLTWTTTPQAAHIVGHPDPSVDVAAVPLAPFLRRFGDHPPFMRMIGWDQVPTDRTLDHLDAIEELTFVGYPHGIRDPYNYTPIIRKGFSATPIGQRWNDESAFLVDASVFNGSSGSPVFVFNQHGFVNNEGNYEVGSERLLLVGIVAEGFEIPSDFGVTSNGEPMRVLTSGGDADLLVTVDDDADLGVALTVQPIIDTINLCLEEAGVDAGEGHA